MEKRRKKRKTIHLNAESISGDSNFAVFIENLSEDGIYMITAPSNGQLEFTPNQAVTIKLKPQALLRRHHRPQLQGNLGI
jgi:hypothetical protein